MFLAQNNGPLISADPYWQPNASFQALKVRAELLEKIRAFFKERDVLEVETPLMCAKSVTDVHIQGIPAMYSTASSCPPQTYYLQTSPEFAMKRLLAAGCGSIYQLCKAFRNEQQGRLHNPEFTILEWYRLNYDHHHLMDEMEALLTYLLGTGPAKRFSYQHLFITYLGIEPHTASLEALIHTAELMGIRLNQSEYDGLSRDDWLDLLMTHCIEPQLKGNHPFFVYDYPASQAALAKIREGSPPLAERFEVYIEGIELANGYHELCDPELQLARFQQDNQLRIDRGLHPMAPDMRLVAALKVGFPACAGVALGMDRLLMLKLNSKNIEEVLSFTINRA
jgi:lysyl-tRNA synthetase class 2